jgi:hypothetical protein
MIKLFTEEEFINAKSDDKLLLKCFNCSQSFLLEKSNIQRAMNPKQGKQAKFCSPICVNENKIVQAVVNCKHCNKQFKKALNQTIKHPNHFCCQSCAATYNNKNKTYGTRRSKMEKYLEEHLSSKFPELKFNDKSTIKSELDIIHPKLKLAFEINGIFHYKPIYGVKKFSQIKKNDKEKLLLCKKHNIDLVTLDISKVLRFTPEHGDKFLSIIIEKINNKSKNISTL